MKYISLFAGIGGFDYGLEACNRQQQEDTAPGGCGDSVTDKSIQSEQSEKRGNDIGGIAQPEVGSKKFGESSRNPLWARVSTNRPIGDSTDTMDKLRRWGRGNLYSCVWANEWDKYAVAIYRYHFTNPLFEGDIRTVDPLSIPEHDLIVGGFPCQSFSIAGKRGGFEDTRGTLFFEICRIARACRTKYLLLENVKGLFSHDSGNTFQTIIRTLDELGYDVQWDCLNSKNFGVPQNRERVFLIGHLRTESRPQVFPIGEIGSGINERSNETSTVGTLSAGGHSGGMHSGMTLVRTRSTQDYEQGNISPPLRNGDKAEVRIIHTAYPGEVRNYTDISPTISTPSGGGHLPMVASAVLTPNRPEKRQNGRRMKEDGEPMFTLTGQDIHGIATHNSIRRLTPIECERLQGFPDNWTAKGIDKNGKEILISDSQRYKCCGNAVTTNVITVIGNKFWGSLK